MPAYDVEKAAAREDLCRFLSACYYEPDEAFAQERLFDSILAAARRLDPGMADCARRLGEAFAAQELQALLIDYARLFLGPPQALARPYGASWLDGQSPLMQDSTMLVLQLYQEAGFEVDAEFMEAPDHIAVELEFLYVLNFRRNQLLAADSAGSADSAGAVRDLERLEQRFLRQHLGAWIAAFAGAVNANAQTAFYRHLAELTERFVRAQAGSREGS